MITRALLYWVLSYLFRVLFNFLSPYAERVGISVKDKIPVPSEEDKRMFDDIRREFGLLKPVERPELEIEKVEKERKMVSAISLTEWGSQRSLTDLNKIYDAAVEELINGKWDAQLYSWLPSDKRKYVLNETAKKLR